MSEIRFKGKNVYSPKTGNFWIPTARVELISKSKTCFCEMLIDSGADITLIRRSLGEFLGLSFDGKKIMELRGISEGAIPYTIEEIKIRIEKYEFKARVGISMVEEVPLILGRLDIFDNFNIEFKQKVGVTVFRKSAK